MKNATFFQASNLSDDEVITQFVVRKKEFELVMSEIRSDDMKGSIQHYIFIGQRGSGKSTLLRRIQAEINTDASLNSRLVAVNLSEEQAGIYRLNDLWSRVLDELQVKGFETDEVDWGKYDDQTAYTKDLYKSMQEALQRKNKKLVLLLDNIDRILDNIKIDDNHLMRELLMNHKDVRIVGGSTRLSEHHWKYDQPFYQFFQIIRIEPLSELELTDLLLFWSHLMQQPKLEKFVQNSRGKLNAVRVLSDGMPRTMLHLVELLINKPEEHGYEYLRSIIDRATPIYQERLSTLSPLQQKVLLELSFYWDAVKVNELSETARMESKLLSGVLKQLVDLKIVESRKGKGKNLYYSLRERFFNLWLIMTQGGPKQKAKVKWLTVFLENWYSPAEFKQAFQQFEKDLDSGCLPADHAALMTKAFVHSRHLQIAERDKLIDGVEKITALNADYKDLLPQKSSAIYKCVIDLAKEGKYTLALSALSDLEQEDGYKKFIQGRLYTELGNTDEAEKQFLSAIEGGYADALFHLALLYHKQNKTAKAKKYYLLAVEQGNIDALFNLANLYDDQGNTADAEKYYRLAIEKGHVKALNNLAVIYYDQDKIAEAEKYYRLAIEKGDANAIFNLAAHYYNQGNTQEAEKYYLLAIEKGELNALNNIAVLYYNQDKTADAEKYFLLAIEGGHSVAMHNLAVLYQRQNNLAEAEKNYLLAVAKGNVAALLNLALLCFEQKNHPAKAVEYFNRYKENSKLSLDESMFEKVLLLWAGTPYALDDAFPLLVQAVSAGELSLLEWFVTSVLSHHQQYSVWQWFNTPEIGGKLKDMLKPLYFATARLLKLEEVILTEPTELGEVVQDVLQHILQQQQYYYGH